MAIPITASMLYDYVHCPHRVALDLFGDSQQRDEIHPFVELLWERGHAFERETMSRVAQPFIDLRDVSDPEERERLTSRAMSAGETLIYGGRIAEEDLLGEPDLLRREASGYVPGDIKSGAGVEGESDDDDGKPKKHYALQLALYCDILRRKGILGHGSPFIWDIRGREIAYDLSQRRGRRMKQNMWEEYEEALEAVRRIISRTSTTTPAMIAACKLCHWRSPCSKRLIEVDDLTLLPEMGRSRRDKIVSVAPTVAAFADLELTELMKDGKSTIEGMGAEMVTRFHERARLQKQPNAQPYFKRPVALPQDRLELFFDVETDPMQGICYLHGFIERLGSDLSTEHYVPFFAYGINPQAEREAFRLAWQYVRSRDVTALYFYSSYEKTIWLGLAKRYPDVTTENEIEGLFTSEAAFDLYQDLVRSEMEWPTYDLSIKTIASYLGFKWRDPEPSGAASVRWYHNYLVTLKPEDRQRILVYNEDDCRAMRVIVDAVKTL